MSFGENVKRLRSLRNLTQGELAEKSGVTLGQISKIERGDADPRLSTIEKLIQGLYCNATDLITGGSTESDAPISGYLNNVFSRANNLPEIDKDVILHVVTALIRVNEQRQVYDFQVDPRDIELEESYEADLHHEYLEAKNKEAENEHYVKIYEDQLRSEQRR